MRLFDLVFLACALALLATLFSAARAAIRGRTQVARRRAIWLPAAWPSTWS
ncbi:MAG: hypothetical protein U0163_20395 [Gemmatimonadaceae bacterium]